MADLGKDVVVVGLSNKAEVWNDDYWREYSENSSEQFEQSASEIGF
jgi:DNA-binding transcriptional regulator/RsmH inhibitor MraZ